MEARVRVLAPAGQFEGRADSDVMRFLGIRYAEPPIDGLRFQPPVKRAPEEELIDATNFGASNFQASLLEILSQNGFNPSTPHSEDCLFLNVYSKDLSNAKKPVMVWIHGGAFVSGSGEPYDARQLVSENDVVVVTINYRLGVFGFLDARGAGPKFANSVNLGIQDQICALEWVRENIECFGGDPNNVTIWGESAGATSVLSLLGAPSAAGLFHQVAAFSGAEVLMPALDQFELLKLHFKVATAEECMTALMALSSEDLFALQLALQIYSTPVLDGNVISLPACEAIQHGPGSAIPVVTGATKDEGTLLAPAFAVSEEATLATIAGLGASIGRDLGQAYSTFLEARFAGAAPIDRLTRAWFDLFRSCAVRVAATASLHGAGGWVFNFDVETDHELGVTHFADVPFAFDWINASPPGTFVHPATPSNKALSTAWSKAMVAFATTGDPNTPDLPLWPKYEPASLDCLRLSSEPEIVGNPDGDLIHLYKVPMS